MWIDLMHVRKCAFQEGIWGFISLITRSINPLQPIWHPILVRSLSYDRYLSGPSDERTRTSPNIVNDFI